VRTVIYSFSLLLSTVMLHAQMYSCCYNTKDAQLEYGHYRQKLSAGGTAGGDGAEVWPYASAGHCGICPSATLDPDRHIEVCKLEHLRVILLHKMDLTVSVFVPNSHGH